MAFADSFAIADRDIFNRVLVSKEAYSDCSCKAKAIGKKAEKI